MGCGWIIIALILTSSNVLLGSKAVEYIFRNKTRCIAQICAQNQIFDPCTKYDEKDKCKTCSPGTFMPDIINTAEWSNVPNCIRNDCNDCDPQESILGNKDTCGKTERAHCVCDRERLYYGENDPGPVTSCTRKEHGDLCNRIGVQLNQRGECEPCPPGTEKNSNDFSLCKKITREVTTPEPGTKSHGTEITHHVNTTSVKEPPPNPNNTTRLPPPNNNDPTTVIVVAVCVAVVLLAIIIFLIRCLRNKKHEKYPKYQPADDGKCCGIDRDSSSMNSSQNSEKELLMKENHVKEGEKEGYPVKPMQKVKPMISVDESAKKEDEESVDSLDAAFPHNRTREDQASAEREQIPRRQFGWSSEESDNTEVKVVHSADETDLKVPYRNYSNQGVDLDRTRVKTVYSEETEVKQIADGESRRILDNGRPVVKPFVKKPIASGQLVSQTVPAVQVFPSSSVDQRRQGNIPQTMASTSSPADERRQGNIPQTMASTSSPADERRQGNIPQTMASTSSPADERRQGNIPQTMASTSSPVDERRQGNIPQTMAFTSSPANQRREGSVPQLMASTSSPSHQTVVLPSSSANQRHGGSVPQMMVSSSPLNKGDSYTSDTVQHNSIQPMVCQPTENSENLNSDAIFGSGSALLDNEMKNTSNNVAHVHLNRETDMEQSSSGMNSSRKNCGELQNSNKVPLCDCECQTETTRGHSTARTISYEGLIISETDVNSNDLVSSQPSSSLVRQTNMSSSDHPQIEQEGMKQSIYGHLAESSQHQHDQSGLHHLDQSSPHQPDQSSPHQLDQSSPHQPDQSSLHQLDQSSPHQHDQSSPHQPDQSSLHQLDQSRVRSVSAAESKQNSATVPSGSSVQNPHIWSVENSGTSSGYATARRSEMGTFDEGKGDKVSSVSTEPPIVNSLLRSESRNSDPHRTEKLRSSDSLGLSRLQDAPSLNPDSSDGVASIGIQQVPPLIKGGPDHEGALERRQESQGLNHAAVHQAGGVESGYCS